jgi:hypothetical protein
MNLSAVLQSAFSSRPLKNRSRLNRVSRFGAQELNGFVRLWKFPVAKILASHLFEIFERVTNNL